MGGDTHLMHGLRVRADVPLHHGRAVEGPPDLELRRGPDRTVGDEPPEGRVLAHLSTGGRPRYTLTRREDGCVLRFHGSCDAELSDDLTVADVHLDPRADGDLLGVFSTGLLVATVLVLRGALVLHASAVERNGRAVAFSGRSGHGKSTLATLAVRGGARLVTDDVLRVDVDDDPVRCRLGATESRLRRSAEQVWQRTGDDVRATADGRSAVRLPASSVDPLPLAAVVVPCPSREVDRVRVARLAPTDALVALAARPRIVGWVDPRTSGEQFTALGRLVRSVPVLSALVPWGPPFDPEVADALLDTALAASSA